MKCTQGFKDSFDVILKNGLIQNRLCERRLLILFLFIIYMKVVICKDNFHVFQILDKIRHKSPFVKTTFTFFKFKKYLDKSRLYKRRFSRFFFLKSCLL